MKVYIRCNSNYYKPIEYVLKLIANNQQMVFEHVDYPEYADIIFDHTLKNSQPISTYFYTELSKEAPVLNHPKFFEEEPIICTENGESDHVATIFYMVNCLQEYSLESEDLDKFERFRYRSSYQYKFNCIEDNLVQKVIDQLITSWKHTPSQIQSSLFISHDIDEIYASFLQDGFWSLKNFKPLAILQLFINEIIRKPHWKNMDKMMDINDEYDIKTTFFWLVNKGKGDLGIRNADYDILKEKSLLDLVEKRGFINGLHKSASDMTIDQEIDKGKLTTTINRYHFLKFQPAKDWSKISDSKLNFDSSLGFAEHYGFRNSYGRSFQPFNIKSQQLYDFIETPLNFMDRTLQGYMKLDKKYAGDTIINFIETNKHNCHISILWHNKFFTNYKFSGYLAEYKKVLEYIYENKFKCLTPVEIVNDVML